MVRARFDDDQSTNVLGKRNASSNLIEYDGNASFCFIAVKSIDMLVIEFMQSLDIATRIIGRVSSLFQINFKSSNLNYN